MILRSSEGDVKLDGFEIPELDSRYLVIKADDIPGANEIRIFDTVMPLLASDYIAYKGQPLLVLFGPDYETTELALEKIKVKTSPSDISDEIAHEIPDPLFFSWGLDNNGENDEEKSQMKIVESSFNLDKTDIPCYVRLQVLSQMEANGNIKIECPAQWQSLVRNTVADALGRNPETISLHSDKYFSRNDQYLIGPAYYAAFTAIAAEKTKLTCEMREEGFASRTGISFHTTTWLDKNNKPRHEETSVVIDQGSWAIAGKELQRQIMVSILPKYSLESYKAVIRTQYSPGRPSIFCGSEAASAAASSRTIHTSRMAAKVGVTPDKFMEENNKDATRFTDWAPRHDLVDLAEKVKSISAISDYERKWSSTALHSGSFGLQGYLYGIGLSSALSTAGFSTTMAKENQFMAQVSYTVKKNVTVSGSVPASLSQDRGIKDVLSAVFAGSDETEPILFLENQQKTPESGPDLLSSYSSVFITQLVKAIAELSNRVKAKKSEPPVIIKFNAQNLSLPCEFEYSGFGAAVAEVKIPKISLEPEVTGLWIDCGLKIPNSRGIKEKIRSTAIHAIGEIGLKLSDKARISVNFSQEKKDVGIYSSLENLTRALTTSAIAGALWQALGSKSSLILPIDDKKIEIIMGGDE